MNRTIPVEMIEDGMILANPVLNQFSQVLIPAGTILTNFHKNILQRWDIGFVQVTSEEDTLPNDIPQEVLMQFQNKLKERLLWTPELEIENDLFEAATNITALFSIKAKAEDATN